MAPGYGNEQTNATIGSPPGDAWFPGPPPAWRFARSQAELKCTMVNQRYKQLDSYIYIINIIIHTVTFI